MDYWLCRMTEHSYENDRYVSSTSWWPVICWFSRIEGFSALHLLRLALLLREQMQWALCHFGGDRHSREYNLFQTAAKRLITILSEIIPIIFFPVSPSFTWTPLAQGFIRNTPDELNTSNWSWCITEPI